MALSEEAKLYIRKAFGDEQELEKTDPEFYEFFSNFAYGEVRGALSLDEKTAHMSQLAVLLGCGGVDEFREDLPAAPHTRLCLYAAMRGVGGIDSWYSDVEAPYHVSGEEDHAVSVKVRL